MLTRFVAQKCRQSTATSAAGLLASLKSIHAENAATSHPASLVRKPVSIRERYEQFQRAYPEYVILMQVGDFYEFYGSGAAHEASRLLDLALNKSGDMTGFPRRSIDTYLAKLLRAGKSVVIADQYQQQSQQKTPQQFDRQVTRIVTPGTVLSENLLDTTLNSFITAVVQCDSDSDGEQQERFGLAWCDISTGLVVVGEAASPDILRSILFRVNPREVIVSSPTVAKAVAKTGILQPSAPVHTVQAVTPDVLGKVYSADESEGLNQVERDACTLLFSFIQNTRTPSGDEAAPLPLFESPIRQEDTRHMSMDAATFRSLDILVNSVSGERQSSLFAILNETSTGMGSRLLALRLRTHFLIV